MNNRYILLLIIFVLFLSGCINSLPIKHVPFSLDQKNKKIVIFFDGTANDEGSHTNISKLYNLVTLQNNPKINSIYIEGVGTKGKLVGFNARKFKKNNPSCLEFIDIVDDGYREYYMS